MFLLRTSAVCVLLAVASLAQESAPAEVTSRTQPMTFKSGAKEVLVRLVVRDHNGNAIGNLARDDFQVFDKSVLQKVVSFRMETAAAPVRTTPKVADNDGSKPVGAIVPDHYIAYLFDDIHIDTADLSRVREAALKHMINTLRPGDRAAIYTTSAQVAQDFTADPELLRNALNKIVPRPPSRELTASCPWMSFYLADLIVTRDDQNALMVVARNLMDCEGMSSDYLQQALVIARMKAHEMLAEGNAATRSSVLTLRDIVLRMSTVPGQRILVLASPGFLVTDLHRNDLQAAIERAVRSNVIVSTLDPQGLSVEPANQAADGTRSNRDLRQYMRDTQTSDRDVLSQIADGAGGTYFHNNNDLGEGFRRTAATPEYSYVLAFSPQNLKSDGSYHPLKVTLVKEKGLTVTARRGYFAPSKATDGAEAARQEIEDALFSREEMTGVPFDLHTEYFKTSADNASVAVMARVHVANLNYNKDGGVNKDDVTVVAAIFDNNGQFVTSQEKLLELHMHDSFLHSAAQAGIVVRSDFEIKPGDYLVRVVVRDKEGQTLSAKNGTVEIP